MSSLDEATKIWGSPDFPPKDGYIRDGSGRYLPYIVEDFNCRIFESDEAKNTYILRKAYGYIPLP